MSHSTESSPDPPSRRLSFQEIALNYGTDKVTRHRYQFMYEKYLSLIRDNPIKLLELGLGCDMVSYFLDRSMVHRESS
jgi:hypothetical protein